MEPDFNAPWPEAEKKGLWKPQTSQPETVQLATASTSEPGPDIQSEPATTATSPALPPAPAFKPRKHEIAASVDFLIGQGDVTLPVAYSLVQVYPNVAPVVVQPDRDSRYIGASLSYSFGQAWYFDFNFQSGESSGETELDTLATGAKGEFSINDDWYQGYIRYTFPGLRGKRLSAYLRAGVTYIQADLDLQTTIPPLGYYEQTDQSTDLRGNLGFGLLYDLRSGRRVQWILQFEGEGFYGHRSQDSRESLPNNSITTSTTLDNDLYGGLLRGTLRFQYNIGQARRFKVFADGGVQANFTEIDYPDNGTFQELLWGPYVKVGLRYAF